MSVLSKPLPADHLLSIFGRVSVQTFLRLPLTCTHWHSLQPIACRQIHTLTLHISDGNSSRIAVSPFSQSSPILGLPHSTLTISHENGTLPEPIAHSLLAVFPTIRNLNLENLAFWHILEQVSPQCSTHSLSTLLRGWATTLTCLGIYGFHSQSITQNDRLYMTTSQRLNAAASLCSLLSTINTLSQLKHLLIDIEHCFLPNQPAWEPPTLRFSILSRLQSFSFTSLDNSTFLLPSLRAYAKPTLTAIRLGSYPTELVNLLAKEGSPLLNSLKHTFYYSFQPPGDFTQIAPKLRNLAFLTLAINFSHWHTHRRLLQALAKCTALQTLHLRFYKSDHSPVNDPLPELVPLPSVTCFILDAAYLTTHTLLSTELSLPFLFPNLVNFTLDYVPITCTVCNFTYTTFEHGSTAEVNSTLRACIHQLIVPLKECTQLKRISLPKMAPNEDYNSRTWEDFPIEQLSTLQRVDLKNAAKSACTKCEFT